MTDTEMIARAVALIDARHTKQGVVADVGSVLVSASGAVFTGVCVGTRFGHDLCGAHRHRQNDY
jgi:hypothetical protein